MTQKNCISNLSKKYKDAWIVASLGTICYDLKEIPHARKYAVNGAMGCAMGVGLGMALSTKRQVIVIIGDGSYNMKAGSVSTIMKYKPKNLMVYIMQNNKYASTGNQAISKINPLPPKSHFRICKVN